MPTLYSAKLSEVKKELTLTGHIINYKGLAIGTKFFDSLPQDIRTILVEEAQQAGVYMTELILNSEEEWVRKFEQQGVTVNRNIDIEAFQQATADVYLRFPDWSDGLHQQVREILAQ